MEIIDSPAKLLAAAQTYTEEALLVIVQIMRTSQSERIRLVAAMALLDRCVVKRAPAATQGDLETHADLRTRVSVFMRSNPTESFDEHRVKSTLNLRSPATAVRATMVQLLRDGELARAEPGSFQSTAQRKIA